LRLLLDRADFVDVRIEAGYEHRPPTPDDRFAVMLARKPERRPGAEVGQGRSLRNGSAPPREVGVTPGSA
ncbi:MAG TPA: hypothetical protein VGJ67_01655, partial [Actinomycetota bacterium]